MVLETVGGTMKIRVVEVETLNFSMNIFWFFSKFGGKLVNLYRVLSNHRVLYKRSFTMASF